LRKLVQGGTSRSYGIQVARIAGLPKDVIERAKEILKNLEKGDTDELGQPRLAKSERRRHRSDNLQLNLFGAQDQKLRKWISDLDISSMTPLEALVELSKMKDYVNR
jgi:DNA mismatch repair protein MutS